MLDVAVRCERLHDVLTGLYRARLVDENGRQRLAIVLETRPGVALGEGLEDRLYGALIEELGRVQPEFADDWQNVYRRWDGDPANRILKVEPVAWPGLAEGLRIKQRGVE
jgi:phenylacetate-CoA ligase